MKCIHYYEAAFSIDIASKASHVTTVAVL